jgi:uncharacterized protein (TIGR03435 family)
MEDASQRTNVPFGALMLVAYDLTVRQLSGPSDLLSERYDIVAKAEHPVSADGMRNMLQTLLAERFRLQLCRETREVPVYRLVIDKGSPKLPKTKSSEDLDAGPRVPSLAGGVEPRSGLMVFRNESLADFAWALSRMAGIGDRVVVDHTALTGRYDFELSVERENNEAPNLFSALREQLGLKLEASREPVEFVVIEQAGRPTEN